MIARNASASSLMLPLPMAVFVQRVPTTCTTNLARPI
jgi:hypothetical protein